MVSEKNLNLQQTNRIYDHVFSFIWIENCKNSKRRIEDFLCPNMVERNLRFPKQSIKMLSNQQTLLIQIKRKMHSEVNSQVNSDTEENLKPQLFPQNFIPITLVATV